MIVLGVESSCDDTAAAVVVDGREIRSNVVTSQAELHARYGGIVPELASRSHIQQIVPVVRAALSEADLALPDVDAIAVTSGPGLAGSLIVGLNMAKGLAAASDKPLIGVNHLQGHAYAGWLYEPNPGVQVAPAPDELCGFPLLCLVVSGGHTDLALLKSHGEFERIGRTRDDAAGEAFDKAARLMGLGYPGGPAIQKIAALGGPSEPLPRAWIRGTWDFSFSGLKTAVLHRARAEGIYPAPDGGPDSDAVAALARAFQEAVADVIATKTARAAEEFGVNGIVIGGGVAANSALGEALSDRSNVPVMSPPPALCTDNGAMIAAAAFHYLKRGERSGFDLDVTPGLTIEDAPSAPSAPAATPVQDPG
ncbi:MAG TPA: tRNA (adenosine(37)-N6)-threonylcarbamoyltransferase complex transferase subunit TsaD [Dehalococcoidia bacterium]|nr:tRNA (adenosine(37)-N6)-threonylcarbamoyltransferase complex transferase subunit TsaD [Chloroflexota bacterium]MDP5877863.1 tRNA (adenosine(37)-N6)-threonylcarbamoyltransferase complex transferase subunit TsaD [Dehalococcoidia bacterium]MDP6273760.1 tRNA (adenosine(37)-N6)-threonylcarbamoyltransferase complex transferase subunit TsaD [Dehalococcoidia bacterium]MDP7160720.1 tRNA (adenosine(37)-N6)-threonylcarbamoyltransferase complex transferase subunit TsaD [Dehalococcoidia bacterium]MDP7212